MGNVLHDNKSSRVYILKEIILCSIGFAILMGLSARGFQKALLICQLMSEHILNWSFILSPSSSDLFHVPLSHDNNLTSKEIPCLNGSLIPFSLLTISH